ncbi:glycosyl hydrolase family 18 protein [Humibacter ginsenosidimutans]|uniref:Chitinase n=1 Tax=Humibacter ginsenosidimutans TaxID=2599293 RepID=A0A5B8M2R6_9MICO|nr:glycosyl hydrolase family 18 protein [Humibacter ginsenosidimutans]QDZ14234.1 chitinase [Humibacter ginsenosidimutans]
MKRIPVLAGVGIAAALAVFTAAAPASASPAQGPNPWLPTSPSHTVVREGLPLQPHLSAPYVDVTEVGDLADLSQASGSKYLSLAFLQTEAAGSCTPYWAGDTTKPVSADVYGSQFNRIRARGGDVIPSFGGYSADTTNTDIADSCTDVHQIALAYENVFSVYKVHRIDLDVEADSITNQAGIDRRNQAIAEVERWGAAHHWNVSFSYTLPSTPQGLAASGIAVLQSAAKYHASIADVNVMTFDYWDGATHNMLTDAETAATALTTQLKQTILPHASPRALWHTVGIVQMNGIDDYGPEETFPLDQAAPLVKWASAHGVQTMSFWALQRDNGGCPGTAGSNTCSGVAQPTWAFSKAFAAFDSWRY